MRFRIRGGRKFTSNRGLVRPKALHPYAVHVACLEPPKGRFGVWGRLEKTDMDEIPELSSSADWVERRAVAHDLWPQRLLERRRGKALTLPERVVWPTDDDQIVALVHEARREKRALIPFGAGSGVCGGISPDRRAYVLDMKKMDRLLALDEERGVVTVEAGLNGERLERLLNARGYTLGHFPSSIYCSTVGGWAATRSAGQLSSRFGKIEDMIVAMEGVDGRGQKIRAAIDEPASGPGALRLLLGSEGSLCIITRLTLRVRPTFSHRWLRGFVFERLDAAIPALQMLMEGGEAPSVIRLYDPLDTLLGGGAPPSCDEPDRIVAGGISRAGLEDSGPHDDIEDGFFEAITARLERLTLFERPTATRRLVGELLARPLLCHSLLERMAQQSKMIVGIEGSAAEIAERVPSLRRRLEALGAQDAGDGPGSHWLRHRHRISYRMARAFAAGGWVDTMEIATRWDGVMPLYQSMKEALRDIALVTCHFSHAYRDGCSLYLTFIGGGAEGDGPRSAQSRYHQVWDRAFAIVKREGAALSHHHGIGRSKAKAMHMPTGNRTTLRALKDVLDPDGILNPGVLGLPGLATTRGHT